MIRKRHYPLHRPGNARGTDALSWQLRLFPVLVSGPSMTPALRSGDALLVRRGASVRPGDVVVARFRSRPDLLVVKRAVREQDGGWWLAGDNEFVTDDSRAYGVADVIGRGFCRFWPRPGGGP